MRSRTFPVALAGLGRPETTDPLYRYLFNGIQWAGGGVIVGVRCLTTLGEPRIAHRHALELAGRKIEDVALFEIIEAFAARAVACARGTRTRRGDRQRLRIGHQPGPPDRGHRGADGDLYELRRRGGGSACCRCAPAVEWVRQSLSRWVEMSALITEGLFRVDGERAGCSGPGGAPRGR